MSSKNLNFATFEVRDDEDVEEEGEAKRVGEMLFVGYIVQDLIELKNGF